MNGHGYYSDYFADEEVINRPVNTHGLTGLLFTNSAYTQPAGSVTFGLSSFVEDCNLPNYSVVQGAATITVGVTERVEVAAKGKAIATNVGSATNRELGAGDAELLVKWRFSSQGETMPALAFGFGWTFPTGSSEQGLTEIKYEGIKLMVLASAENRVLNSGFVGVYLEAQAVFNDQLHKDGESPYKEKYGVINAGILFPISDDNRLQFLLEYNRVLKKEIISLYEGNYTGVMPGLRFVTENFNISVGLQRINRELANSTSDISSDRLATTINYRF